MDINEAIDALDNVQSVLSDLAEDDAVRNAIAVKLANGRPVSGYALVAVTEDGDGMSVQPAACEKHSSIISAGLRAMADKIDEAHEAFLEQR